MNETENAQMFDAEVIQYMRPNGREVHVVTSLPKDYVELYEKMRSKGWNFAAESLMTGAVCVYIEDKAAGEDIDQEVVANGPNVQRAMCDMLVRVLGK